MYLSGTGGGDQWNTPTKSEAITPIPGRHPAVRGWSGLMGGLMMQVLRGSGLGGDVQVWGALGQRGRVLR